MELKPLIRDILDFPKKGIVFKDITPLLNRADAFRDAVWQMARPFKDKGVHLVVGAESRGFIFAASMAVQEGWGFVPVRKPGKLPFATLKESYELEYGSDSLEIHRDAISPGQSVLLVDDLLATGGTMDACCRLVEKQGGKIVGLSFLIELAFLKGRARLDRYPVHSLITY